jgi:Glycosyl hydrolases family 2, TIM barrel domain
LNHFDILDFHSYDVGFRTFTAIGDDFYLNGRPYKIRGANHLPNILRPNDAALADWFTKIIHDKNINFSRAHSAPMTDTWFKAANKNGVAISQEGTWPWLMHRGDTESIPPPEVLRLWLSEWLALVNQHKNHPSLLMWTMNNESKLHLLNHPTTWNVLSDAIKALRRIDPTRPIVADSGYARKFLEETGGLHAGTDDGDVDDVHKYYNWYDEETFFFLRDGVSFTVDKTPGRPFISQELSTGYPDADSGHPIKHYIYTHFSPQAWVGRWAYEDKDPQYFLERHAQITKETAEVLRSSYRESSAGVMMFALNSWFKNVYDVDSIEPWPTLEAVSMAHEPVMACLNLNTRNFYVGTEETVNAFVVNDSRDYEIFNDVVVNWQIIYQDRALSSGSMSFSGSLAYFENFSGRLTFSLPDSLPERKVNAVLRLRLHGNGRFLSTNEYKITVCDTSFAKPSSSMTVAYFGNDQDKLVSVMERAGISVVRLNSILEVSAATPGVWDVVVIGRMQERPIGYEGLLTFMSNGGHILFQDNGEQIMELFPSEIRAFQSRGREIVTPVDYGRSIFTDIDVMDLSWFNGSEDLPESPKEGFAPFAARGMYNVNYDDDDVLLLAEATAIHGYRSQVVSPDMFQITGVVESAEQNLDVYFPDMSYDQVHGYPLFKVRQGSGAAIVSSMLFEADKDPISNRLLINVLEYLKSKQEQAIVIDLTPVASTPAESTTPSLRVPSSAATCYGTGCGGGSYFYLSQLSSILMFVGLFVI